MGKRVVADVPDLTAIASTNPATFPTLAGLGVSYDDIAPEALAYSGGGWSGTHKLIISKSTIQVKD